MSTIKYLVFPDWVRSRNDGQRHFINAEQLMELYHVNPSECVVLGSESMGMDLSDVAKLTQLRPRYDGNYDQPAARAALGGGEARIPVIPATGQPITQREIDEAND